MMDGYRRSAHAVYLVNYHIIFVTKYRRPCIDEELGEYIKKDLTRIIRRNKGSVSAIECEKDHVHLLAELPLDQAVAKLIGVLKGTTSRNVRKNYPEKLAGYLWGDSFWSDSYFITTTGGATLDVVKQYVNSQHTHHCRQRKYSKSR